MDTDKEVHIQIVLTKLSKIQINKQPHQFPNQDQAAVQLCTALCRITLLPVTHVLVDTFNCLQTFKCV